MSQDLVRVTRAVANATVYRPKPPGTPMITDQLRSLTRVLELDRALMAVEATRKERRRAVEQKVSALERAESELLRSKEEIKRLERSVRDQEQRADEAKGKIAELKAKRDSASSARMLSAVEADMQASEQAQEDAETNALEQMEALDTKRNEAAELERRVEKERGAAEQARQQLDEALSQLQADEASATAERESELAKLEAKVREQYERLHARFPKDWLVTFDDAGYCDGCSTKLPPDVLRRARAQNEWTTCPNCARLLYDPVALS